MRSRVMPKPSWNLEYMMWIFTRISGLSLILLAVLGIGLGLIMGARIQMWILADHSDPGGLFCGHTRI